MSDGAYVILAGLVIMALVFFIKAYRQDHPKKKSK
jgi:hypothetical protein